MAARVSDVISIMDEWVPRCRAIREDNPGLQVGDPSAQVESVAVALDATPAVVDEATATGADMLITHHPLLFNPVRSIETGSGQGALIRKIIMAGISVYSAHTNLDVAEGGVEDLLAAAAGLKPPDGGRLEVLDRTGEDALLKLVVFVPKGYEDAVREAMSAAGAGWIGKYSDCSFMTQGAGTFKALEGANPFLGEVGNIEYADEFRIETILPESAKSRVLRAMLEAHPYEEVAFDLYPLKNGGAGIGFGRVGDAERTRTLGQLAESVCAALGAPYARVFGDLSRPVTRIATSAGSGGGNVEAAAAAKADVLVTGDLRHAQVLKAMSLGLSLIDVGHFSSERLVVSAVADRLNREFHARGLQCTARACRSEGEPMAVFQLSRPPEDEACAAGAADGGRVASITAFVDGGSRGNPGPAAYAAILIGPDGEVLAEDSGYLEQATNNVAEYRGVIMAARMAHERGAKSLLIKTDSELVARQLRGEYQIKNAGLAALASEAMRALRAFESWEIRHIPREENSRADALVNRVLDSKAARL